MCVRAREKERVCVADDDDDERRRSPPPRSSPPVVCVVSLLLLCVRARLCRAFSLSISLLVTIPTCALVVFVCDCFSGRPATVDPHGLRTFSMNDDAAAAAVVLVLW